MQPVYDHKNIYAYIVKKETTKIIINAHDLKYLNELNVFEKNAQLMEKMLNQFYQEWTLFELFELDCKDQNSYDCVRHDDEQTIGVIVH